MSVWMDEDEPGEDSKEIMELGDRSYGASGASFKDVGSLSE